MTTTLTSATAPSARRVEDRAGIGGITLGFVNYELRRLLTRQTLIFTLVLPAALYHTGRSGDDAKLPHGNFAAWMMLGIAVYGAAMASTSTAAAVSVERTSGWMRTIRLTPVRAGAYILVKVGCAVVVAALPVLIVGLLGFLTGARADGSVWLVGLVVAWLGSAIFAALGIFLGLALRPEVVMHMPGLTMTVLAFLGNLFIPLSGTMLAVSRYTPMYGVATLARYPLDSGYNFSGEHSSLVGAVINVVAWLAAFSFAAARRFARGTGRQ